MGKDVRAGRPSTRDELSQWRRWVVRKCLGSDVVGPDTYTMQFQVAKMGYYYQKWTLTRRDCTYKKSVQFTFTKRKYGDGGRSISMHAPLRATLHQERRPLFRSRVCDDAHRMTVCAVLDSLQ